MAKTKISEWSTTPSSNADIDGINIAEGCAPSGINDAIRDMMAQIRSWQSGATGDPFAGPVSGAVNATVGATTPTTGAFTTLSASSTVTLSGGTANGVTYLNGSKVLTSGSALTYNGTNLGITGTTSDVKTIITATTGAPYTQYTNSSSTFYVGKENSAGTSFGVTAYSSVLFESANYPIVFATNSVEQMRLTTTGLGIGTSSPFGKLAVSNGGASGFEFFTNYIGGGLGTYIQSYNRSTSAYMDTAYNAATHAFYTSGSERMRLDSSGNLGLGVTPSAWTTFTAQQIGPAGGMSLWAGADNVNIGANVYYNAGYKRVGAYAASSYQQGAGAHYWNTAGSSTAGSAISFTTAMTLNASANLAVNGTITSGTTGTNGSVVVSRSSDGAGVGNFSFDGSNVFINDGLGNGLVFKIASSEKARIDSSGNLLVGVTSGSVHTLSKSNSNDIAAQINNTSSSNCYGLRIQTTAVASNSASFYLLRCADSSATRADIRADGGLANYSANNANLSDQRVKTDIQNAGGYLTKICAIPVRTFKYKDQTDDLLNLGVIAQEVEAVAPELVDTTGFGETPDDGVPLKAIYQTDLQYALMKALQELKAEFDAYKASHP